MLTLFTALALMAAGETGGPSYPACPDGWEVGSTEGWEVGGKCVDPSGVIWTYDGKNWTTEGVIWSADGVIW